MFAQGGKCDRYDYLHPYFFIFAKQQRSQKCPGDEPMKFCCSMLPPASITRLMATQKKVRDAIK